MFSGSYLTSVLVDVRKHCGVSVRYPGRFTTTAHLSFAVQRRDVRRIVRTVDLVTPVECRVGGGGMCVAPQGWVFGFGGELLVKVSG